MVTAGNKITLAQMEALFDLANSKAGLAGDYDIDLSWTSELQRIRTGLIPKFNEASGQYSAAAQISGPWPLDFGAGYGIISSGYTINRVGEMRFYYTGDGTAVVSVQQRFAVGSFDPAHINDGLDVNAAITCKVIIGGNKDVRFRGRFAFTLFNPSTDATATPSTDFPGISGWSYTPPPPIGLGSRTLYTNYIDTTVSPGEYEFSCTGDGSTVLHHNQILDYTVAGDAVAVPTLDLDCDAAEATPGIHSSENVYRVNCTPPDSVTGYVFGIWSLSLHPNAGPLWITGGYIFSADREGWWCGKTIPVATLPDRTGWMPWNELDEYGEPVGTANEQTPQPVGDPNAVTARYVSEPKYPTIKDGDTNPWLGKWWTEFNTGWLDPDSSMYEIIWWLRRIRINRVRPVTADQDELYFGAEIEVTLGCVRAGNFVSFGTYQTGSWVEFDGDTHLLWPIFTRDVLVYQAAERVDVQAEIIGGLPTFGATVQFPIMAHYYNDTETLLNLLP